MSKLCILIPAYNCADFLEELISKIKLPDKQDEIIILDDGSSDNTYDIAKSMPRVIAFKNEKNQGFGYTSHKLYKIANERNADYSIHMHGDFGHNPDNIPLLIEKYKSINCDVVVGSRLLFLYDLIKKNFWWIFDSKKRNNMPLIRVCGHFFLTALQNWCYNTNLHSFHDGMRLTSRKVIDWVIKQDLPTWYDYDTNLLLNIYKNKFNIEEIAIPPYYNNMVKSSAPPFRYGIKCAQKALRYKFKSKK